MNLESLAITEVCANHIFAGGRCPLSLLSPEQIPPHIRQDHSQGACVVEDLVAPTGVEEVGDDAEAPLEEGLAARAGRGDVPKARFQGKSFLFHWLIAPSTSTNVFVSLSNLFGTLSMIYSNPSIFSAPIAGLNDIFIFTSLRSVEDIASHFETS